MAVLIRYTKYTFKIPPIPSVLIYETWKKVFPLTPNFNLEPKYQTFLQSNKDFIRGTIFLYSIFAVLVIIYVLGTEVFSFFKAGGVFDTIMAILLVIFLVGGIGILLSLSHSYRSYSTYKFDSKRYYSHLRKLVEKSNNYNDFEQNYNKAFKSALSKEKTTKKDLFEL